MNSTKKLLLYAGIFFQTSAILCSLEDWQKSLNGFGGAKYVYDHRTSMPYSEALKQAQDLGGSAQDLAVGQFMARGIDAALAPRFKGADSRDNLLQALNVLLNPVKSTPAAQPVAAPAVRQPVVSQPVAAPASSGWASWLSGSSAQSSDAAIQKAIQAQKSADAAAAAASNQALASLVDSGATGLNLYKGYIDLIFNLLQQAVNAIVDPAVQQQVIGYAQNKLASMKASAVAANRNNSRTLGRMNSKKVIKKHNNSKRS